MCGAFAGAGDYMLLLGKRQRGEGGDGWMDRLVDGWIGE